MWSSDGERLDAVHEMNDILRDASHETGADLTEHYKWGIFSLLKTCSPDDANVHHLLEGIRAMHTCPIAQDHRQRLRDVCGMLRYMDTTAETLLARVHEIKEFRGHPELSDSSSCTLSGDGEWVNHGVVHHRMVDYVIQNKRPMACLHETHPCHSLDLTRQVL